MRELREFRAHHAELKTAGIAVAGVTRDTVESNAEWSRRLELPYPLLSDAEGEVGRRFGVTRQLGIGGWKIDLFRRSTFLIDAGGVVAATWHKVKVRGHAREIIAAAQSLPEAGAAASADATTPPSL